MKVTLELEVLKSMQEGHGGWNDQMAQVRPDGLVGGINILVNITVLYMHVVCAIAMKV